MAVTHAGFPGVGAGVGSGFPAIPGAGFASGFRFSGWAIAFLVLFFIGYVFYTVWGSVGPLFGGGYGGAGFFW
jgi:hypothetical protein